MKNFYLITVSTCVVTPPDRTTSFDCYVQKADSVEQALNIFVERDLVYDEVFSVQKIGK